MKRPVNTLVLLLACALWLPAGAFAQTRYEVADTGEASLRLLGTSTVHDWEMEATHVSGTAELDFAPGSAQEVTALRSLTFNLAVKDLQSDSKGMDNNAYKALNADAYERIDYVLSSATLSPETGGYLLKTKGQLTIAGTTKDILMDVHLDIREDGTITCRGTYDLKMTDYEVTPPTFLLGVMKTGDDLTLEFSVAYQTATGA